MSGGSYDYLYTREWLTHEDQLLRMADRLSRLGYRAAADETSRVLMALRQIDENTDRLRDAWRAVEWLDSGDSGIESTVEKMQAAGWRRETAPPEDDLHADYEQRVVAQLARNDAVMAEALGQTALLLERLETARSQTVALRDEREETT